MALLSTTYLGLPLKNPIVVSSSSLTQTVKGVRACAEYGAAAVVLKSLFEEQIASELTDAERDVDVQVHPEADEYVRQMGMHLGPGDYLTLIEQSKAATSIPIIASVNCVSGRWWSQYARQIEAAGADAIELNIAILPRSRDDDAGAIERTVIDIVSEVRGRVDLPISVKLGPYFTSLRNLAPKLRRAGAGGLVLFNRFYQFDINLETLALAPGYQFSDPHELYVPLRFISLLAGEPGLDLVGSTGIHDGAGVAKMILAGATAVELCSVFFRKGLDQLGQIVTDLTEFMEKHNFGTIDDFRGRLSQSRSESPDAHERLQYIKALTGWS